MLTLTGRTELWGFVWDKFMHAPLLGHGFDSAEFTLSRDWWGAKDASVEAHNTWLQSLLVVGVIGTIPFVWWHLRMIGRWLADPQSLTRYVLPYILVLSMTEVEGVSHTVLLTLVVFLAIALDAARIRKASVTP